MSSKFENFSSASQKLSRNPLGILALFILLVYGMASLVTGLGNLNDASEKLITYFLVSFPILVLFIFYILVTKHHDKLYAPSDFSNQNHFKEILELQLEVSKKSDMGGLNNQDGNVHVKMTQSEQKKQQEVIKAKFTNLLNGKSSIYPYILFLKIKNELSLKFRSRSIEIFRNSTLVASMALNYFWRDFFEFHNNDFITITDVEPFSFVVEDHSVEAIKELYQKNYPDETV